MEHSRVESFAPCDTAWEAGREEQLSESVHMETPDPIVAPLLSLPHELLQLVLAMLDPHDLRAFLVFNKAMAQQVVQRSSGNTALVVPVRSGKDWAATRHLLQWAAPAYLVLTLPEPSANQEQHGDLTSILGSRESRAAMPERLEQQRFMFLTELCFKGLTLPWVVPPGLGDACPNLFTLALHNCTVTISSSSSSSNNSSNKSNSSSSNGHTDTGNSSNSGGGSSSSSSSSSSSGIDCSDSANSTASRHVAHSIRQLRLHSTSLPQLGGTSVPELSAFAEQLQVSLPSLSCLEVDQDVEWLRGVLPQLIGLWSSQLTAVHASGIGSFRHHNYHLGTAALGLQKLVMPYCGVSGMELPVLLQLQQVTHLEVDAFSSLTDDLSRHACSWKYLHIHHFGAPLEPKHLAKVPLHSLTSPLQLGHYHEFSCLTVMFSKQTDVHEFSRLQHLGMQLAKCGVHMCTSATHYEPKNGHEGGFLNEGFDAMLSVVGAFFGAAQRSSFWACTLSRQAIQSLGSAHQHRLQQLILYTCSTEVHAQPFWESLLAHLPGLKKLACVGCCLDASTALGEEAVPELVAAMAQQPAGRRIRVCFHKWKVGIDLFDAYDVLDSVANDVTSSMEGKRVVAECHYVNTTLVVTVVRTDLARGTD